MKQHFFSTGFSVLLLTPLPALAQVAVNPAALQQLAGIEPPPPVVMETAAQVPVHHWKPKRGPEQVSIVEPLAKPHPAAPSAKPVQQATVHVVPPPAPPKPAAPPVPVMVKPAAPVTLTFAPDSDDLPANAADALKPFCAAKGHVSVSARAPAVASDPSAAMRLSLSRAMAVQSALTACGVPPQNILPRALGAVPGQNEDEAVIGVGAQ